MDGYGAISHMIKSAKANRQLQKNNRLAYQDRLNSINRKTKVRKTKQLNDLFLEETRPEVIENRQRLAKEIVEIRRQDTLKTVISVILSLILLILWVEKCWY